jgi:hypothetical protein
VVRTIIILASTMAGLALAGCGAERDAAAPSAAARPAAPVHRTRPSAPVHRTHPARPAPRTVIVFRRVRYEGATLRTMTVRSDGSLKIDVPGGGAGGAKFEGRLRPRALRGLRRAIARTPWHHLSRRTVLFDRSGAYFMLHYRGQDVVAMASGMSVDLEPLIARLNRILTTPHRVVHRFGRL